MTDYRTLRLIALQSETVMFGARRQHSPSISEAENYCQGGSSLPAPLRRQAVRFHFITSQCSEPASV